MEMTTSNAKATPWHFNREQYPTGSLVVGPGASQSSSLVQLTRSWRSDLMLPMVKHGRGTTQPGLSTAIGTKSGDIRMSPIFFVQLLVHWGSLTNTSLKSLSNHVQSVGRKVHADPLPKTWCFATITADSLGCGSPGSLDMF